MVHPYSMQLHHSPSYGSFDSLDALVRAASDTPLPDEAEERRLVEAVRGGDEGARDALVRAHLRLVVDEAIRYREPAGWDAADLVLRGLRGLRDAVHLFDPEVHGRFRRFAREWIRSQFRHTTAS
jgi:DNA-directed RNA polymerase sigma subunit (sigma70/sigma32)